MSDELKTVHKRSNHHFIFCSKIDIYHLTSMKTLSALTVAIMSMATSVTAFTPLATRSMSTALHETSGWSKIEDTREKRMGSEIYEPPPGWVGGFRETNPKFPYPQTGPDLSSLGDIQSNYANIEKITRMQRVLWPEFSWLSEPNDPTSRVFQKLATDISRIGYDDQGRVHSIICPQMGQNVPTLGNINVEVTVNGVRGWVDEPSANCYADMSVTLKMWLTKNPDAVAGDPLYDIIKAILKDDFPDSKENGIVVATHNRGQKWNPLFSLTNSTSTEFEIPEFALHWDDEAYGVAHLFATIGDTAPRKTRLGDDFAKILLDTFSAVSGGFVRKGNTLSWNVWLEHPEPVDTKEWETHSEKWRKSIGIDHQPPHVDGFPDDRQVPSIKYYDGSKLKGFPSLVEDMHKKIKAFFLKAKDEKIDSKLNDIKERITNRL